MLIEMWKDQNGYRLKYEDSEFDLTEQAYRQLIEALTDFEGQSVTNDESMYESLQLDLEDK